MVMICVPVSRYGGGVQGSGGSDGDSPIPPPMPGPNAVLLSLQEEDIEYYDSKADTEFVSAVSTVSAIPFCTMAAQASL